MTYVDAFLHAGCVLSVDTNFKFAFCEIQLKEGRDATLLCIFRKTCSCFRSSASFVFVNDKLMFYCEMDDSKAVPPREELDSPPPSENEKTIDDALVFLRRHQDVETSYAQVPSYVRKLRRKVDLYVISFLTVCYTLNFLDKVLYNVRLLLFSFQMNRTDNILRSSTPT